MAPVLTLIFTPLFTLMLLAFLATMAWTGSGIVVGREVLIGFDLLLALVAGLVLYAISARDPQKAPGFFDALQLLLVVCALVVDAIALWAIAARISEFGFSPNKVAALGENLILLVTLGWSAVLYARFLAGRVGVTALERWQTRTSPSTLCGRGWWSWSSRRCSGSDRRGRDRRPSSKGDPPAGLCDPSSDPAGRNRDGPHGLASVAHGSGRSPVDGFHDPRQPATTTHTRVRRRVSAGSRQDSNIPSPSGTLSRVFLRPYPSRRKPLRFDGRHCPILLPADTHEGGTCRPRFWGRC